MKTIVPLEREAVAELRTEADVVAYARRVGVAPGLVLGRLQAAGCWPPGRGDELRTSHTGMA